ncbi:protein l(2)37Cc [Jimgerdemannia flammicorona]|uniref:Prohibitin n=1 Tax=Jimgerdemannia flammicorona TaxID=994334 RepID=A0A433A0P3_9FUNG|nr:protein l(2)37Cc [Jimgerdemannia flammicorona]
MTFGREFTNAVEQKQIAQQEAERAKFIVEKVCIFLPLSLLLLFLHQPNPLPPFPTLQAEQEKLAAIIRAEGDAQAAELISKALEMAGEGLIEFRRIEASKDIAATLSGARNVTYLPSGGQGGSNLLLNVQA